MQGGGNFAPLFDLINTKVKKFLMTNRLKVYIINLVKVRSLSKIK